MNNMRWVNLVVLLGIALGCGAFHPAPSLRPDIVVQAESEATPWTHLKFKNSPREFQFAIVSDRVGGHRPGVFRDAVHKLSLLRPEFVISVGDLIEGYAEDRADLDREWNEFEELVGQLEMPFFHVPGNHDISNELMSEYWQQRFGPTYYHFIYRDVLFLCLNTEDPPSGHISDAQVQYVSAALAENEDVRWTLVFLHQPLWTQQEETGWEKVEGLLQGRPYTVFAGHWHAYSKSERLGRDYFVLATTGGSSSLAGPLFGAFDQVVWVTITKQGPRIANLLLDGIWDKDVCTEQTGMLAASLLQGLGEIKVAGPGPFRRVMSLPSANPLSDSVKVRWQWQPRGAWRVEPQTAELALAPGEQGELEFELTGEGSQPYPLPEAGLSVWMNDRWTSAKVPFLRVSRDHRISVPRLGDFQIDGAPEEQWTKAALVEEFEDWTGQGLASPTTQMWLAHDQEFLYVFSRLDEPHIDDVRASEQDHDGRIWLDDCMEVFLHPPDQGYYHIMVNAKGVTYDCYHLTGREDLSWDPALELAVGRQSHAWTLEMAVPFEALGRVPVAGESWRGNFCRERYAIQMARSCWSCTFGGFHKPDRFGEVIFE